MQKEIFKKSIDLELDDLDKFTLLSQWSLVKITGENAGNFLQGQVTCDVTKITEAHFALSALCNHQGRVLAVFCLFKRSDGYYALIPTSIRQQFITHLSKFAAFSKVLVQEVNEKNYLYGCIGNECHHFIEKQFKKLPTQNFEVSCENGMLICLFPGVVTRYLIWREEPLPENQVSENDNWTLVNILSGYASIYIDTIFLVTPHMLNLHLLDAVSFNKGCYVGQEIIARTQYLGKSKRHLYRAQITENILLAPGELIYSEGQEAGVVIESALFGEGTLLLVVLQDPLEREFSVRDYQLVDIKQPKVL